MFKKIDHIEIVPGNLDRTIKFYTEVLGFKVQSRRKVGTPPSSAPSSPPPQPSPMEEVAFIEQNGILIEMFSIKNPAPMSKEPWQVGFRRIALEVEDMDKLVEHCKAHGVEVHVFPGPAGPVKMGELTDPDGMSIQLMQRS
jgi:glyoxylase I family protein